MEVIKKTTRLLGPRVGRGKLFTTDFPPSAPVATVSCPWHRGQGQARSLTPHALSGQDGAAGYDATGRLLFVGPLLCVQKLSCGESADKSSASTAGA